MASESDSWANKTAEEDITIDKGAATSLVSRSSPTGSTSTSIRKRKRRDYRLRQNEKRNELKEVLFTHITETEGVKLPKVRSFTAIAASSR